MFSDYLVAAITTSCVLSAAILLTVSRRRDGQNVGTSVVEGRSPFTTWVRSWLYMATAVCILAVDFPAFPRRYAKCENFGVSLMDTGVGWYVVVHAMSLNNATTRDETSAKKKGEEEATRTRGFLRWVRQTLPLLILGLVRLITVKSVEYPEHVSEYGVHFNFFFTLFFLKVSFFRGEREDTPREFERLIKVKLCCLVDLRKLGANGTESAIQRRVAVIRLHSVNNLRVADATSRFTRVLIRR